jgi:glycine cleavage system H lipoate-binding protein
MLRIIRHYSTKIYNTKTNEWYLKKDNYIKIGLTKKAIEDLNEIVYIEFPNSVLDSVDKDDELVLIESIKAVGSINAPIDSTEIVEHNIELEENLDILNKDPENENKSWIIKIKSF